MWDLHRVRAKGDRTQTTDVWLLPEDEAAYGARVAESFPSAAWRCSQPGPSGLHQVHLHPILPAALACGGVQAFMPLPAGAGAGGDVELLDGRDDDRPTCLAILQLLRTSLCEDDLGAHIRAGRLAVKWNELEVGAESHRILTEQVRQIWIALRDVTLPAPVVALGDGRPITGKRIGPAARRLVVEQALPLTLGTFARFQLET